MKKQVSPVVAVLAVVLAFGTVMGVYWKGLLGDKGGDGGPMGGGGGGMPPPPLVGMPTVTVSTLSGPAPNSLTEAEGGLQDGPAREARFDGPSAVAVDAAGVLYVTDGRNHRVRAVSPDGTVRTIAGSGPVGSVLGGLSDGPAATARFWGPSGLAAVADGSMLIVDTGNHRVRRLSAGTVSTVAGSDTALDRLGLPDGDFADGPGAAAKFRYPTGICALPDGSCLIADTGNRRLRKVAPDGTTATVADLSPAGAQSPCGVARYPDGRILVVDPAAEALFVVTADGAVSPLSGIDKSAPIWSHPTGLAIGADSTVYVADTGSHCIMRIPPGGSPQLLAGVVEIQYPSPGFADGTGSASQFTAPSGIAIGPQGELYVADFGNNCVRKIVIAPGT